MKRMVVLMLVMTVAGCQTQQKPAPADTQAARATLPSVLDVTAPAPATTASSPTVVAVDPVATPAAAVTQTPTESAGSSYTVKKGDTLFHIAKEHYGDGKKWQQIAAANPGVTPTSLKVGQTLVMPQ